MELKILASEISYLKHYPSRRRCEDQNSKIIPYITNWNYLFRLFYSLAIYFWLPKLCWCINLQHFHENSQHSRIENHFHPGILCSLKLTIESLKFWNFRWQNLYSFEIHNAFSMECESRHLTSYSNMVFYFKSDLICKTSHFPIIYFYKISYLSRLGWLAEWIHSLRKVCSKYSRIMDADRNRNKYLSKFTAL